MNPIALNDEEMHNRKVYEGNIGFAEKIMRIAKKANDYEESSESGDSDQEGTWNKGELMVLLVDMGSKGCKYLNAFSKECPH